MPDQNIDILMRVQAETAGAQQAANAIDKTTAAVEKAADESERYNKVLEQMAARQEAVAEADRLAADNAAMLATAAQRKAELAQQSAATKKYEQEAAEELAGSVRILTKEEASNAEAKGKSSKAARDLKDALGQLGREFPILGAIGRAALSPIVGIATLGFLAIQKLQSSLKALEASLQTSTWESSAGVWKAQADQISQAAIEAREFANQILRVKNASEVAKDASDKLMTVWKARQSAEDRLDESRKQVDLAAAGSERDPLRRAQKELEIEERYAARKLQRQEASAKFERDEQYRKLANEEIASQQIASQLTKARERLATIDSEREVTERLADAEARLVSVQSEFDTKQDRLAQLEASPMTLINPAANYERKLLRYQMPGLERVLIEQRGMVRRLKREAPGRIADARGAAGEVSDLESALSGSMARADDMAGMLPTHEAVWAQESRARSGEALMGSLSRAYRAASDGQQRETALGNQIASAIQQRNNGVERLIRAMEAEQSGMARLDQKIADLERRVANLR